MTTTADSQLAGTAAPRDSAVTVAVKSELMTDYQLITPYADPTPTLAAAPLDQDQVAFYTVTGSGGVAQIAPDPASDTGWIVNDLQFNLGTATGVAAYLDTDQSVVVWAATATGVYSARSTDAWSWSLSDLGVPGWPIGGVRTQQAAWLSMPPVAAVAAEYRYQPQGSALYCQASGQAVQEVDEGYPAPYADWSPGPVMLPGQSAPVTGAFVNEPGAAGPPSLPAGIRCVASGPASAFLEGTFAAIATTVNMSGWLEAFAIDAGDSNSLNYLQPAGNTFTKIPIAQLPANGRQVASYPVGSLAAATDGQGVVHVIGCTTDGTLLHVRQDPEGANGWAAAAPIAELGSPAELSAVTDHDGDVHVFARADRTGQVTYLLLSVATGEWTIETVSTEVPHSDYVQQIATYSATLTAYLPDGRTPCGQSYTITATDPVTIQIDGSDVSVADGISYEGITGPDGQVAVVWATTSLSMPVLYAWFEGMPDGDTVAVDLSGPVQAEIRDVTTGEQLLSLPTALTYKRYYGTGTVVSDLSAADAAKAATAIDKVMGLTGTSARTGAADHRLHSSSRPHAARYIVAWDGRPADAIDRTGCPDQYFRLDFSGDGPLYEELDADSARQAEAEMTGAGSWLSDMSWGDVFGAVADAVGAVTHVLVRATSNAIHATITMVVDGVTYLWKAIVSGVGQLLDLVQTIFARLAADFWTLVGWIGWVFNWNDILLTHQAIAYFAGNGAAWASYGLTSAQGQVSEAIAGLQASIGDAVSAYLQSQVPDGSTLGSLVQSQPPLPPGADASSDPRNVFLRGLRNNGNSATVTPSSRQPSAQAGDSAADLLNLAGQYATAAEGAPELQPFITAAQPTQSSTAGLYDQPMASVIEALGTGASFGLGLVQSSANTLFSLAEGAIDGITSLLTQTWDIPLVTDIYRWVTDDSELSALDVICLLLAIPATITYKALFGSAPVPDDATLAAVEAAYPPPPTAGGPLAPARVQAGQRAGAASATPTPLEIGARLGNILTGLSYMTSGVLEARVDLTTALWGPILNVYPETPRCPASWTSAPWLTGAEGVWEFFEWAFVLTEFLSSAFSLAVVVPDWSFDCSETAGLASWLWVTGNIQWILDTAALLSPNKGIVQTAWKGAGSLLITVLGLIQIGWQIIIWYKLGAKGWLGSAAAILTAVPNAAKFLVLPSLQQAFAEIPFPALAEACIDVVCNAAGGTFYVLAATIGS
jgi:hypothetical protein